MLIVFMWNNLYSCQILTKLEFSKNFQISNLTKILSVGAEVFQTYRRTDITKLIVAFRHIANAPKNDNILSIPAHAMRAHRRRGIDILILKHRTKLNEWSTSHSSLFKPEKRTHFTNLIRGCVGLRVLKKKLICFVSLKSNCNCSDL
jgi:hypothetical protein